MRTNTLRILGGLLALAGAIVLAVGIVYLFVSAGNLPSFLEKIPRALGHRDKRAIAGIVVGVALLAGSADAFVRAQRRHRHRQW